MSAAAGGEGRIFLDTEDLRRVATKMRGASVMLSQAGRELVSRPMPSMPAGMASAVTEVARRANAELQDLALELLQEAGMLSSRATWAELGGGDALAWMIPGLQHVTTVIPGSQGATPASVLPPVSEEQIIRSERWAASLLNEMHDSLQLLDDQAAEIGDQVGAFGSDLIGFTNEYADQIPVEALGAFAMAAGVALEAYERHREGVAEAGGVGLPEGMGAGGGAVGAALSEAALGWTGMGLVGCLVAGGTAGGLTGDRVGDEVLD